MKQKDFISIQVDEQVKAELTAKAKAEDLNLSQFCRRLLKQHLAAHPVAQVTSESPAATPKAA